MPSRSSSDAELLAEWDRSRSERAFHELVARYAGLVHAAARRTCGDESIAAEASQLVFILLAKKAGALVSRASLAGWLHSAAVMQTKNLLRGQRRETARRQRLHASMNDPSPNREQELWAEVKPVIDDALASLPEKDREALLLHFYRSLTAREIAETLGIATAAAKKRIERAVERLKGKLATRGVDASGSLSSVMLAGFAADAEAVGLPLKWLAAKAIAAGTTVGGGSVATTATVFMKASSLVPPVLALAAALIWIAPKREAVAAVERKYLSLEAGLERNAGDRRTADRAKSRSANSPLKAGPKKIDWEAIAIAEADERASGRARTFRGIEEMLLDQRLEAMSGEEAMAELVRIDELDLSEEAKRGLESQLYHIIARMDPAFALEHLEKWLGVKEGAGFALTSALKRFGKDHPAEAEAWLDRQIAEGKLEVKRLDGRNWDRDRLEGALIHATMVAFPDRAKARLLAMPSKDRNAALGSLPPRFPQDEQIAYAELVREVVDVADRPKMIARLGIAFSEDFKWVDDYLGRIEATDGERSATYERATRYSLMNRALNRKLSERDVVKTWEWIGERLPESRSRLVGEALGLSWSDSQPTGFDDVANLVIRFNGQVEDDAVLVAFLKSKGAMLKKDRAREMAERISDDGVKAEMLEALK